jgi:hypothetical protein
MDRAGASLPSFMQMIPKDWVASRIGLAIMRIFLAQIALSKVYKLAPFYNQIDFFQALFFVFSLVAMLAMLVGYQCRLSTALTGVIVGWIYLFSHYGLLDFGIEVARGGGSNAVERDLILLSYSCLILASTPCGDRLSFDSWKSFAGASVDEVKSRGAFLFQILVISVYFWTAVSKLTVDFTSGVVFEAISIRYYIGHLDYDPAIRPLMKVFAWVVIFSEFSLALGLSFIRTRTYALFAGSFFHLTAMCVLPVMPFSQLMIVLYLGMLSPKQISRVWMKITQYAPGSFS